MRSDPNRTGSPARIRTEPAGDQPPPGKVPDPIRRPRERYSPLQDGRCAECLLGAAIAGMTDGLVLVDPTGRVVQINRTAQALLGLAGRRSAGVPLRALIPNGALARFWRESQGEDQGATAELELDGGRMLRASVSPCVSHLGGVIGRALLLRDISDERRVHLELSAEVARRLASLATRIETPARLPPLTRREADVLAHLARGLSNAAIGVELGVSVHTVGSHVKKLYAKLGVKSRAAAAALAAGLGPAARPQACSSADSMSRTRSRQYSTPTE